MLHPPTRQIPGIGTFLLLGAGAFLLLGCAAHESGLRVRDEPVAYEIDDWSYRGHPGRRIVTDHYDIFTTLHDDMLLRTLPQLMENAFEYYQTLAPPAREVDGRMKVYLFVTRRDWAHFTRRFAGPKAEVFLRIRNGGYSERGVTVIKYSSHQHTFPIMAHEGFHQYLENYVSHWVPAWINEGTAVMCEGQRWADTRLDRFDPWHSPARRNHLADALLADELFPLAELLETNAGRIIHRSSRAVGTYYAQLWALILFAREGQGGKYADGFARLMAALGEQTRPRPGPLSPGERLFRTYVTDELETFEREFRAFIRERMIG